MNSLPMARMAVVQLLAGAASATLSGCTVLNTADDLEQRDTNFICKLRGFGPHLDQKIEIRLVANPSNLRALAILDPIGGENFAFEMPGALADRAHRVLFFADLADNGYNDPPEDHTWALPVPPNGVFDFSHSFDFTPFDLEGLTTIGQDLEIRSGGIDDNWRSKPIEIRVLKQPATGSTWMPGFYRGNVPDSGNLNVVLEEIIEARIPYRIAAFIDLNENGEYDAPTARSAGDPSWLQTIVQNQEGMPLVLTTDLDELEQTPLDLRPPPRL